MTEKCFECNKRADYRVNTQFSGQLYFCEDHLEPEDRPDAVRLVHIDRKKQESCANPYCDCAPNDCMNGKLDIRDYHSYLTSNNNDVGLALDAARQAALSKPAMMTTKHHSNTPNPVDFPAETIQLDPRYLRVDFKEHFSGGFATRPHEVTCSLFYSHPSLDTTSAEATGRTHHRAKADAMKLLQAQVAQQLASPKEVDDFCTTVIEEFMNPTKVQYLLDKLQEEAAEVIQAVSKIRRFGPTNHHPERNTTNLQELVGELEDLQAIVLALEELNYFDPKPSTIATIKKFNTLIG